MSTDRKVGLAICGLGRAGKIHFNVILNNPVCKLKYIVDQLSLGDVKSNICRVLEKRGLRGVQIVDAKEFNEVHKLITKVLYSPCNASLVGTWVISSPPPPPPKYELHK